MDRVERMKAYLRDEMGITTYPQLIEKLRSSQGINIEIFRKEAIGIDLSGSQSDCGRASRKAACG